MSYTWTNGELITAEKLNNTGSAGVLIANLLFDETSAHLDKTWKEIRDAYVSGVAVRIRANVFGSDSYFDIFGVTKVTIPEPEGSYLYSVITFEMAETGALMSMVMQTYNENGYPSIQNGDDDEESGEPA